MAARKTADTSQTSSYVPGGILLLILLLTVPIAYSALGGCWKPFNPDEELLADLVHKNLQQRRTAAQCIREMRPVPEIYISPLMKALDDQDPEVRHTAAEALGEVGSAGRPFLNELAKISNEHRDTQVRVALQRSVEKINYSK